MITRANIRAVVDARRALRAVVCVAAIGWASAGAAQSGGGGLETRVGEAQAALEAGRYGDAYESFVAATQVAPRTAALYLGAGYAAAMLGQSDVARRLLEQALTLAPDMTDASLVLGRLLYRTGSLAEAVTVYEAALAHAPDHPVLNGDLARWRDEATLQQRSYRATGAHFSVQFEGPSDDLLARRVVEMLEQSYYRVGTALGTYPARAITVVLYTQQQFRDVTRSPEWAGGMFDGRIKIPIRGALDQSDALQQLLDHEFVHALVATFAGPVTPAWLNEGLATALESGGVEQAEAALARNPHRLRFAALDRGFARLSRSDAEVAYAQSAVAVRRMLDLRGAPAVVSLLQAIGRGIPFDSAFQASIAMRLEDFFAMVERQ